MNDKIEGKDGKKKEWGYVVLVVLVAAALLISGIAYLSMNNHESNPAGQASTNQVVDANMTAVTIPLNQISQTATWYEYNVSGATVRFFAVMDSNGTIHTAFDECWMCWNARLGFSQDGEYMVENCCNMSFPISQITKEGCSGDNCYPIFLQSMVVGDDLMITKSALVAQRFIFLSSDEQAKVVEYNSTHVAVPLSMISANTTWCQYGINGTSVRFFLVKDSDGMIHSALDSCPKCFRKHMGFRQFNSELMVENCCNMAFPIKNITLEGCSIPKCHPAFLPSQIIGDQLVVAKSDLLAGSYMFVE